MSCSGIRGYVRLSRKDLADPGEEADKIARHQEILLRMCREATPPVPLLPEEILVEFKGGDGLDKRPVMRQILDEARSGELRILVTMAIDRLTRNPADSQQILDAFFCGEIDLVICEGRYRFDENLDTALFDIYALVGKQERQRSCFRRKVHNDIRAEKGQLSCGFAPYGYRWIKPHYDDNGHLIEACHFKAVEDEYPIVEEIFALAQHQSALSIAQQLTRRFLETGTPAPPSHHNVRTVEPTATVWHHSTVTRMIRNPFYAGYPAKRGTTLRGKGRVKLEQEKWVMAEQQGTYPHPVPDMDAWETLVARHTRKNQTAVQRGTVGLLTGLIRCPEGYGFYVAGTESYGCGCERRAVQHPGQNLRMRYVEAAVMDACFNLLAHTDTVVQSKFNQDTRQARKELHQANKEVIFRIVQVEIVYANSARFGGKPGDLPCFKILFVNQDDEGVGVVTARTQQPPEFRPYRWEEIRGWRLWINGMPLAKG